MTPVEERMIIDAATPLTDVLDRLQTLGEDVEAERAPGQRVEAGKIGEPGFGRSPSRNVEVG
jgi:hypothetical protein